MGVDIWYPNTHYELASLADSTFDKKWWSAQCSNQALTYVIVYIDENFQAATAFSNLARYLDFGRDMK